VKQAKGNVVLLKLAISDRIEEDKYSNLLGEDVSVYEISVRQPSPILQNQRSNLNYLVMNTEKYLI
jgi:hypothetical protein